MPMKRDDERRWVEMQYLVPGTPEQVWHAMATGPGMAAWFTKAEVDGQVGGRIAFEFEGMGTSTGVVTTWQPPVRFAYEESGWSGNAPPCATEIVITARSGDVCVVRMVHSLFTTEDTWDDELENFEKGWPGFFEVLRMYLREHAGKPAATASAAAMYGGSVAEAWKKLAAAFGLVGADVGDRCDADGSPIAGSVVRIRQDAESRDVMLRMTEPAEGVAWIGAQQYGRATRVNAIMWFYGEDAGELAAKHGPGLATQFAAKFPERRD